MSGNATAILSRPVDVARLPQGAVEIVADAAARARLAAAYDLVAVDDFRATAELAAGPRGSVEVEGRVVADIVQTCVVSLVPVTARIDEPFSLRFVRPADAPPPPKPGAEIVIDLDRPDPPEVLTGPTIDLGAIAEEAFALAIDPYPHAPGAALPPEADALQDPDSDSPFAVLAGRANPGKEGD
jgi:uncharacterized metal-binding protein YceD (DUF177 family)